MTVPDPVAGYKFWLYLSQDGGATFTKVCGLNSTDLNFSRPVIEAPARDCAEDGDDAPVMVRAPGVRSWSITGAGRYKASAYQAIYEALNDDSPAHWKVVDKDSGSSWVGLWVGTDLGISAPADGQTFADVSLSLVSSKTIVYTPGV